MSSRSAIAKALVSALKQINGNAPYLNNIFDNCSTKNKFWDECKDFPSIFVVAGQETREYLPGGFQWGHLGVSLKVYVKNEEPLDDLESLLKDVELVLNNSTVLVYDDQGHQTTELRISSIVTDEGLLAPYGIGEVNISIQYQVL